MPDGAYSCRLDVLTRLYGRVGMMWSVWNVWSASVDGRSDRPPGRMTPEYRQRVPRILAQGGRRRRPLHCASSPVIRS